jgi:hypothetical protein
LGEVPHARGTAARPSAMERRRGLEMIMSDSNLARSAPGARTGAPPNELVLSSGQARHAARLGNARTALGGHDLTRFLSLVARSTTARRCLPRMALPVEITRVYGAPRPRRRSGIASTGTWGRMVLI